MSVRARRFGPYAVVLAAALAWAFPIVSRAQTHMPGTGADILHPAFSSSGLPLQPLLALVLDRVFGRRPSGTEAWAAGILLATRVALAIAQRPLATQAYPDVNAYRGSPSGSQKTTSACFASRGHGASADPS